MKIFVFLFLILFQALAQARVEVCQRKAKIAFSLVSHYWLRTDLVEAGMGSARDYQGDQIGDVYEGAGTKVFIIDHSTQKAQKCKESLNHDEECINRELEIGKPIGRFTPFNNCLTFVRKVLRKCETPEYKALKKERMERAQKRRPRHR